MYNNRTLVITSILEIVEAESDPNPRISSPTCMALCGNLYP